MNLQQKTDVGIDLELIWNFLQRPRFTKHRVYRDEIKHIKNTDGSERERELYISTVLEVIKLSLCY